MAPIMLTTLVLISLVLQSFASPVTSLRKRSFKIDRVERHDYVPNGRAAMKRAYLKFGLGDIAFKPEGEAASIVRAASTVYSNVQDGANPGTEDGETPAVATQNDAQFLSPVMVGGQQLILNFDSGSADMWVFNTQLPPKDLVGHDVYDPKNPSAKFAPIENASFNITYGDGSYCSGPVGYEVVDIGGSTVERQAVGLPNRVSKSFASNHASNGLVGLAFSKLNTVQPEGQRTFFDNIMNDLTLPLFTAQLKGGTVGSYEFGRIDESAFTGKLAHVPIDNSRGFWEFDSRTATANGVSLTNTVGRAIADTGTSLMLVEDAMVMDYYAQIPGARFDRHQQGFVYPCNVTPPDLHVAVGPDYTATVPGAFMNFANVHNPTRPDQNDCFGGLQSVGELPFYIFGDVWFKSQFVAFQATGPSLGIAPHS